MLYNRVVVVDDWVLVSVCCGIRFRLDGCYGGV